MKTVKLFVEGGGSSKNLHTECRRAFNSFLSKSGLEGHMPRIVPCGSRNEAYSDYCTAIKNGEEAILLVDSESPVIIPQDVTDDDRTWKPWHHLKNRRGQDGQLSDNWGKPQNATDNDCHLMVELMESWFLADIDALKQYYGQGFNESCLPRRTNIENISKSDVEKALKTATKNTQKGIYSKGKHSFEILERINPYKVIEQSKWANRFIKLVSEKMRAIN